MSATLSQQFFALLSFSILAHTQPKEILGVWALFSTFVVVSDMTRHGLIQNSLLWYHTHDRHNWKKWLSAALLLNTATALGLAMVLLVIALIFSGFQQSSMLLSLTLAFFPSWILQSFQRFTEAANLVKQNFIAMGLSIFVGSVIPFLGLLLYYWMGWPFAIYLYLKLTALGYAAGIAVTLIFFNKEFKMDRPEKQFMRHLLVYGRYNAATNFFSMIFQRIDTLLLGVLMAPSALACYNIATRLSNLLDLPMNGISLSLLPEISQRSKSEAGPEQMLRWYKSDIKSILAIQIPIALITVVAAPWIVRLVAGNQFEDAVLPLQILAFGGMVKPIGRIFGLWLDAMGLAQFNFKMLMISAGINLFLNVCLISLWGITGAAAATAFGILCTIAIGHSWLFEKLQTVHLINRITTRN